MSDPDPVVLLLAAVAAHLGRDTAGVRVVLADADRAGVGAQLVCAGVLTAAECLREVAEDRDMPPVSLVRLLTRAHAEMTGGDRRTPEGRVLEAVAAHLGRTDPQEWAPAVAGDPAAAVRVAAAAMSWRARDRGCDPLHAVRSALHGLSASSTRPAFRP